MENQVKGSKRCLEDLLGIPVDFFCYPYGEFDPVIVDIVRRAGYRGACSCIPGLNAEVDPYLMRRTLVVPDDSAFQFERKLCGAYDPIEEALYAARRYLRSRHGRFSQPRPRKAATVSDLSLLSPSP
jgi:peptidoglycan/xylan/chitin deacetylase (PgdA/CDA1 family)